MAEEMKSSTGAELEPARKAQLAALYESVLEDKPLPGSNDPEAMSRAIVERILASESFEEAFRPQGLQAWRESHLNRPVKVLDVHFNNSTIKGGTGPAIYAVVDLVDLATGETATVSCGGRNVLVQLIKMVEQGWQDKPVKLVPKATSEGYEALWLEAA